MPPAAEGPCARPAAEHGAALLGDARLAAGSRRGAGGRILCVAPGVCAADGAHQASGRDGGCAGPCSGAFSRSELLALRLRPRFRLISREAEQAIAAHDAATIAREFRGQFLTGSDDRAAQVVRVGQRVAQATEAFFPPPRLHKLNWKFNVIDGPEKQAVVLPGGQVFVFTGLLDELRTDHALAAVLSHQAAHMLLSHDAEKMSRQLVRQAAVRSSRALACSPAVARCVDE